MAVQVFKMLANGMGGLDLAGVPLMCEWLGIEDIDGLLHRLFVLKSSNRNKTEDHGTGNTEH